MSLSPVVMSRADTYEERNPLAEEIRAHWKNRDQWDAADRERMSGVRGESLDLSRYDEMSDIEVLQRYIQEEAERRCYENERR